MLHNLNQITLDGASQLQRIAPMPEEARQAAAVGSGWARVRVLEHVLPRLRTSDCVMPSALVLVQAELSWHRGHFATVWHPSRMCDPLATV